MILKKTTNTVIKTIENGKKIEVIKMNQNYRFEYENEIDFRKKEQLERLICLLIKNLTLNIIRN